jgi:hypothetical protein
VAGEAFQSSPDRLRIARIRRDRESSISHGANVANPPTAGLKLPGVNALIRRDLHILSRDRSL